MFIRSISAITLIYLMGCTTVQSLSLSNYSPQSGRSITNYDRGYGFLHLTTPDIDKITDSVISEIQDFCKQGTISNIKTILYAHEFILIQSYVVQVTANCPMQPKANTKP